MKMLVRVMLQTLQIHSLAEERLASLNECNMSAVECRLSAVYQPKVRVFCCKSSSVS